MPTTERTPRGPGRNTARRTPVPRERTPAGGSVSPVQFVEPEHTRELPEQHHPVADRSETVMYRLRTPFDA